MGDGGQARRRYEDAVEFLCRNTESLRELIGPGGWEAPFATVRDGVPMSGEWQEALRELDNAAEAAGVPGGIGLEARMGAGDWLSGPTPRSVGWICPTGRCARVDLRTDGPPPRTPAPAPVATPTCALADRPMRLVEG